MIPLTPILLVAAAQCAVANRPLRKQARRSHAPDPAASLGWIHRLGYWSHFDAIAERSSWPLGDAPSFDVLAAESAQRRALRDEPETGALLLYADRLDVATRRTLAVGENDARAFIRIGVVTCVVRRSVFPWESVGACDVVWVVGDGEGGTRIAHERVPFDAGLGDRFVHWWDACRRSDFATADETVRSVA